MAEIKTKVNNASVVGFIRSVPDKKRREDGLALLKIFKDVTGEKPKMWGTSMIGFGLYHYKSTRSTQEGDWPLVAFSPRKQNLTLYVLMYGEDPSPLLKKLGKHKRGGGCLYINKLEDVDLKILKQLIKTAFLTMKKRYKT